MAITRERAIAPARYYGLLWRWHFLAALIVMPFVLWQSTTGLFTCGRSGGWIMLIRSFALCPRKVEWFLRARKSLAH